ncbi:chromosome partitioning protein [Saccharopolyspora phatthalungensis]|uniref:chromosome partitioning protein n=1 Tax=Saccharopolyspora phatthalungensis TaxID=664693 RepID=UPI00160F55D1|nr:chromosome partitioning protein [Saccharopolyspora phatthalungensis]
MTTFSVAMAARWPGEARCVLIECDPSGGDIATRFSLPSSPGLVSLAAAARRTIEAGLLWQHTQPLPGGLPVVAAPPGADHARAALAALAPGRADEGVLQLAAGAPDTVVIADCGRVDPGSVVLPIVRSADVLLVLSRAHADDLAHVATRLNTVSRWSARPGLLLVGEGYSTAEVSRELGVPAMGRIPEDRRGAAVLCGRRGRRRGPSRSALGRTARGVAQAVLGHSPTRHIGAPSPVPILRAVASDANPPETPNGHRAESSITPPPNTPAPEDTSRTGGTHDLSE